MPVVSQPTVHGIKFAFDMTADRAVMSRRGALEWRRFLTRDECEMQGVPYGSQLRALRVSTDTIVWALHVDDASEWGLEGDES